MRLDALIDDPNSSFSEIGGVMSEDTALASRVLRIANSALFSLPSKIETISRAMTVIGTQQLRDLVFASSVIKLFSGVSDEFVSMEAFWRHSIGCGIAARVIAIARREANVERYYTLGLLHDIGRLIIYSELPEHAQQLLSESHKRSQLLYEVEREISGLDHARIGGKLLKEWGLPASNIEAVAYHHSPMLAERYLLETATVHVADIIANSMQLGSSGERFVPPLNNDAWALLTIQAKMLPALLHQINEQYHEAVKLFLGDDDE